MGKKAIKLDVWMQSRAKLIIGFLGLGNIKVKISYQNEKAIRVFNSKLSWID
ncbi:hypothetical protein FD20_GL000549 [Liquorilactobacillus uvarum DSM 19971]|uniref:Uncharacterized protein n=1 Tax=Liquorilactobacillus uvarum DSM 19971 TaxID=1423812 RepID=A0A0R1PY40_9LACO|nr:hypothetical protein FD20_GL000549 [Liquorilactobacillus uvarum DSM 19971]